MMKKGILWLVVSGLMALSLVMAACGTATTPTTTSTPTAPTTPAKPGEEPTQKETVKPSAEVPKYGGTVTYSIGSDPTNFDSGTNRSGGALSGVVYDQFVDQDWTRGPAGSGVTNFAAGIGSVDDWGASFIDSWSIPRQIGR